MPQLPFEIPKSLASYAEHFEAEPIKATARLKKQLKKRGSDAVGHFLLAWFYHLKGMNDLATEEALKARIFAPGSPFFEKLHYYLSHPQSFEAWTPQSSVSSPKKTSVSPQGPGPVLNLDSLIQKLTEVESERIRISEAELTDGKAKEAASDDNVDDIVSETLALIHEKQGKTEAAIRTFQRLKKLNKEKRDYYNKQILRLQSSKEEHQAEG